MDSSGIPSTGRALTVGANPEEGHESFIIIIINISIIN